MKLDSIVTKVGGSFYALIPSEVKKLFKIDNGSKGEMEVQKDRIILTFILEEKIEEKGGKTNTIR